LAETYLKNNGILSGGVFYKKIENIAFNFVRNAHMGTDFNRYGLMEITMAVNGQDANVFGAETQAQFKLSFLPGLLANLGIYGNYTFTQSSATILKGILKTKTTKFLFLTKTMLSFLPAAVKPKPFKCLDRLSMPEISHCITTINVFMQNFRPISIHLTLLS
jgi:outer membrane receptor protein involved in Fe transport